MGNETVSRRTPDGDGRRQSSRGSGLTRRDFLLGSAGTALLLGLGGAGAGAAARRRPRNLILIISDTLRADRLGCYGASFGVTPHLDAFARRSTRFQHYFTCASLTGASHASMMTGVYQPRHSITGLSGTITPGLKTIASVARDGGCQTAAFVSNGVLTTGNLAGIERGFSTYDATDRDGPTTVALATDWLCKHGRQPFFLWVHAMEPHGPYDPVDEAALKRLGKMRRKGDPATIPPLPESGEEGPGGIPNYQLLGEERDPAVYRARYTAKTAYADAQLGRLLAEVHKLGLDQDTAIALTSDHGECLGERNFWFQHGVTLLQAVLHVPLIIAGPGLPRGHTVPAMAGTVDLMPTLLDLLGLRARFPQQLQGRSLVPLLQGQTLAPEPRYAMGDYESERGVFVGLRKYTVRDEAGKRVSRLVDLATDPLEQRDLSSRYPAEAQRMAQLVTQFEQAKGPAPAAKPKPRPKLSEEQRRRLKALGYTR